jgi:hypothetical protein
MMNQQPDKLFREKLEPLNRPVSATAWDKVESRLDKRNNKLWMKVAASLLLIALVSVGVWLSTDKPTLHQLAEEKTGRQNSVDTVADTNKIDSTKHQAPETKAVEEVKQKPEVFIAKENKAQQRRKTVKNPDGIEQKQIIETDEDADQHSAIALVDSQQPIEAPETTVARTGQPDEQIHTTHEVKPVVRTESITIVLTANEVNDKYLDKKSLAEATSEEKKPSTLRKLLDKAYDLKNNEDAFGDLRQKKNEILALNFKNDKQRSENK